MKRINLNKNGDEITPGGNSKLKLFFISQEFVMFLFVTAFLIFMFFYMPRITTFPVVTNPYQMIYGCVGDQFNSNGEFLYNTLGNDNRTACGYFIDIFNYQNAVIKTQEISLKNQDKAVLLFQVLFTIGFVYVLIKKL